MCKKLVNNLMFAATLSLASQAHANDEFFVYVSPDPIGVNAFLEMGKIGTGQQPLNMARMFKPTKAHLQ